MSDRTPAPDVLKPPRRPKVVMLVKRFPRRSETFILHEILELGRQGTPLRLVAVMDPCESWAQPEADALRPHVTYLRTGSWAAAVMPIVRAAIRHPRGLARAALWAAGRNLTDRDGAGRHAMDRSAAAPWRRVLEGLLLVDLLDTEGPVHIHAHFANAPAAVAFVAHLVCGVPYSFTAHAKDLYTSKVESLSERCAAAAFVATCTGANGEYLRDVVGADPAKVKVLPHGIALDRFGSVSRRPAPGLIVSVGRLVPKKGFAVLIDACRLMNDCGVTFECVIVGDGPLRVDLEGRIQAAGLGAQVHLEPGRPQPALLDLLGRAEVFALAPEIQADGDRDGIPNVILEAMTVGLPVVATAISGIPEVIADRHTGRLVPPSDPDALATVLSGLLADPTERQRLGDNARVRAMDTFGLEARVAPLKQLFEERLRWAAPAFMA